MINKIAIVVFLFFIVGFITYTDRKPIQKPLAILPSPTPSPYIFSEKRLFILIKEWKMKEDGYTYKNSDFLCNIAKKRLIATKSNWSHEGFYYKNFCEDCYLGENLAKDGQTEEETLTAWLNSPKHREILQKNYTHSCLKCDGNRCVQIFGYY